VDAIREVIINHRGDRGGLLTFFLRRDQRRYHTWKRVESKTRSGEALELFLGVKGNQKKKKKKKKKRGGGCVDCREKWAANRREKDANRINTGRLKGRSNK